jgi:hypothetical protein
MILPNARVMFFDGICHARFTSAMLRSHKDDLYAESKPGWLSWMTTANQTSESTLSSKMAVRLKRFCTTDWWICWEM